MKSAPPAAKKLINTDMPTITTGIAVESIPSAMPLMIIVALPVSDDLASFLVGLYESDV